MVECYIDGEFVCVLALVLWRDYGKLLLTFLGVFRAGERRGDAAGCV